MQLFELGQIFFNADQLRRERYRQGMTHCRPLYVGLSRARKERTSVFASGLRIECAISSSHAWQSGRAWQDRLRQAVASKECDMLTGPLIFSMIFIDRERHGVIEQTEARSWAAKMSPNGNSSDVCGNRAMPRWC